MLFHLVLTQPCKVTIPLCKKMNLMFTFTSKINNFPQTSTARTQKDSLGKKTSLFPSHMLLITAKLFQSCLTLCDPIDSSPSGSPVPGILQARTLEWGAISFSDAWKWKVKVKSLSRARLLATPWTAATRLLGPWVFQARALEWVPSPCPLNH